MTNRTVRILLPTFQQKQNDTLLFKGYFSISNHSIVIYFVEQTCKVFNWEQCGNQENVFYGLWNPGKRESNRGALQNFIIFKYQHSGLQIEKLIIYGYSVECTNNCIVMLYDYDKFKDTEIKFESNDEIAQLQSLVQNHSNPIFYKESYKPIFINPTWLSYSMVAQHVCNCINLLHWFITSVWRDKKISIRQGNLILAVFVDILLGYLVLQYVMKDDKELIGMLMGILEKLIESLYSLLKWLMGAPAGLKLNNAFNKMLGKYFSYHIQLWWLFLDVTGEKLVVILHIFRYIGYAGITFQAAIISDMLCVATFHSYCIYVYAARLFNIQVSGLIALLRLFVGRKYNPLRGGIDSCEYTNQELFVGTVAFTILLLLMPTTTMYYAVFTLFRLMSLVFQHILAKLIYMMQTQSVYVVGLWLTNSSKVAGKYYILFIKPTTCKIMYFIGSFVKLWDVLLEVINNGQASPMALKLKLFKKSVNDLINNFKPPVKAPPQVEWGNLLSNVLTGNQII